MKSKLLPAALAAIFTCLSLIALIPQVSSAASPEFSKSEMDNMTLSWVNRASIDVKIGSNTIRFVDRDLNDNDYKLVAQGYDCFGEIYYGNGDSHKGRTDPKFDTVAIDIDYKSSNDVDPVCGNYGKQGEAKNIKTQQQQNTKIFFNLSADRNSVVRVDGFKDWAFSGSGEENIFIRNKEKGGECSDKIVINLSNSTYKMFEINNDKNDFPAPAEAKSSGCYIDQSPESGVDSNKSLPLGRLDDQNQAGAAGLQAGN